MKPGHVVSLRVSPKNCMAVVDLLRTADVPMDGMSFSAAVSRALDLSLTGLQRAGHLPERDGYEYSEMMAPFGMGTASRTALDAQAGRVARMFEAPPAAENQPQGSTPMTKDDAKRGLRELIDLHGESSDAWGPDTVAAYNLYMGVIYG